MSLSVYTIRTHHESKLKDSTINGAGEENQLPDEELIKSLALFFTTFTEFNQT